MDGSRLSTCIMSEKLRRLSLINDNSSVLGVSGQPVAGDDDDILRLSMGWLKNVTDQFYFLDL